jgi:predicted transcriptional regulator
MDNTKVREMVAEVIEEANTLPQQIFVLAGGERSRFTENVKRSLIEASVRDLTLSGQILSMLQNKVSEIDIANKLDISITVVSWLVEKFEKYGLLESNPMELQKAIQQVMWN